MRVIAKSNRIQRIKQIPKPGKAYFATKHCNPCSESLDSCLSVCLFEFLFCVLYWTQHMTSFLSSLFTFVLLMCSFRKRNLALILTTLMGHSVGWTWRRWTSISTPVWGEFPGTTPPWKRATACTFRTGKNMFSHNDPFKNLSWVYFDLGSVENVVCPAKRWDVLCAW